MKMASSTVIGLTSRAEWLSKTRAAQWSTAPA